MASVRGPFKTPKSASQESEKQRLEREKKDRLIKRNLEKERIKKQILEVCNGLKLGNSNDIEDETAIANLCQLLKQLAELSDLKLDSDITESSNDLSCLLKLLKTHRYGFCNISTCCEILKHLLEASGLPYSTRSQADLLKELSELCVTKSSYDTAITTTEQLAKLASELEDKKLEAETHYMLFKMFYFKGSIENAKLQLEKCVQCSEASGDELTIGYSKFATAAMLFWEQNYEKALATLEEFLETAKRLNNKLAECEVTLSMGTIYCSLFNIQKALNLYSKALKLTKELGNRKKVLQVQLNQKSMYTLMGEYKKSYDIGKQMLNTLKNYEDKSFEHAVLSNLSVDALILNKDDESLKLARDSLVIAEELGVGQPIAASYGNIGLAQEKLRHYDSAIKSYEKCLENGKKIKDNRIINNSYCNLGRAYEGRGDKKIAKEYYHKALDMDEPLSSHWCDTEDFRFSPDYLLGKMAVEENDYPTAKKYFQQVVDRCEKFRKNVHDSPLKICFNDTQKKPFQYLQHVLLKEGDDAAALLVGEMGRGRDFYDKVIKEKTKQLTTSEALADLAKTNNQAVLFLSKLDVVEEMRIWFIAPDGTITSFHCPLQQWEKLLNCLVVVFSQINPPKSGGAIDTTGATEAAQPNSEGGPVAQPSQSHATEFRGVDTKFTNESGDESEDESEDDCDEFGEEYKTNGDESGAKNADNDKASVEGKNVDNAPSILNPTATQGLPTATVISSLIDQFSKLIDKLSGLILHPIESHLENLVSENSHKPELLIIPQGQTFNIPYATLRLQNGEPLCSMVSPHEAFSFHSYSYSTTLQQEAKSQPYQMKDVLIVGNPTNNLKFAEKEAKMIAQKLGVTVTPLLNDSATCSELGVTVTPLLKDSATRSEVLSRLPQAPIIHFACHGATDGKSLILAPERDNNNAEMPEKSYLTVEDISNLSLQANMVVLSACNTARGKISSEGVLGLARAFIMAGAKSVVTALWAVNDNATEILMSKFYGHLSSKPVVSALATTMYEMEREGFDVTQWGSFKIYGANVEVFSHFSHDD